MKVDVDAVHRRICHLLAVIRTPSEAPPFSNIAQAALIDQERRNQQLVSWTRLHCGLWNAPLRLLFLSVYLSICAHSQCRISWSIFTKIGTDVKTSKSKVYAFVEYFKVHSLHFTGEVDKVKFSRDSVYHQLLKSIHFEWVILQIIWVHFLNHGVYVTKVTERPHQD